MEKANFEAFRRVISSSKNILFLKSEQSCALLIAPKKISLIRVVATLWLPRNTWKQNLLEGEGDCLLHEKLIKKKLFSTTLLRNKRFLLKFWPQQNASKFAIFYIVYKKTKLLFPPCFFRFATLFFFPLIH